MGLFGVFFSWFGLIWSDILKMSNYKLHLHLFANLFRNVTSQQRLHYYSSIPHPPSLGHGPPPRCAWASWPPRWRPAAWPFDLQPPSTRASGAVHEDPKCVPKMASPSGGTRYPSSLTLPTLLGWKCRGGSYTAS